LSPIQDRCAKRTALADKSNASGARHTGRCKGRIQSGRGIHHAKAVRSDQAQAAATNPFQNFAFQLAAVFSVLLKSGRDNDSTSHSGFDAFRNNVWNSWGWRHNHCEVHRLGDLSHPRVCLDTEDACMFHAHRINRPAKRAAYQTPQHGPPYASSPIGGANYCDRLRMKDGVQRLSFSAQYIVSAIM